MKNRNFKYVASVLTVLGLATGGLQAFAQRVTYTLDLPHSQVEFGIKHMAISTVRGRFAVKEGTIQLDAANVPNSSVEVTIDVTSIDTGVARRDTHLKSPDFFDAAMYPTATFKSTKVVATDNGFDVIGDLTLHGVTRAITLHMEPPSKEQIGMDNKPHRGFAATASLHRHDFGLVWNGLLKSGDPVVGDDVMLTLAADGEQQ